MTENSELKQSVTGWKTEVLSGSGAPLSLEEATFILSAGFFGAVFAYGAIGFLATCCVFAIPWGILLGAVGGAAGAAIGAAERGPIGGISGALLGTVLTTVAVGIIEIVVRLVILIDSYG